MASLGRVPSCLTNRKTLLIFGMLSNFIFFHISVFPVAAVVVFEFSGWWNTLLRFQIQGIHCFHVCVCVPILVTTFPEWLSGTEPLPHTPGALRPSSLCL